MIWNKPYILTGPKGTTCVTVLRHPPESCCNSVLETKVIFCKAPDEWIPSTYECLDGWKWEEAPDYNYLLDAPNL